MKFLTPWVAAGLAAIVVPLLVLLYFLKLRRRQESVPSTFLWKRAVQDLQVNAPFQKLRRNLLLLLQLLVLAAALLALARPMIQTDMASEKSVILMIDTSASMNSREESSTRLEMAKEQAVRLCKTLNRSGSAWLSWFGGANAQTRAMVIAFADQARIVSPFTTNTAELIQLIEAIEPTDAVTDLSQALELAQAYMMPTRGGVEQAPINPEQKSTVILFSDGCIDNLDDAAVHVDGIKLIPCGEKTDNVGITNLRARRSYEKPEILSVFLGVQNFGPSAVTTDVALYVDGVLSGGRVETVTLGAARDPNPAKTKAGDPGAEASDGGEPPDTAADAGTNDPAAAQLTFELPLAKGALIEARLSRDDVLSVDNRANVIVAPPRRMRILCVTGGNVFLEFILRELPLEQLVFRTPAQYEAMPESELSTDKRSLFDLIVFDKHSTARLPQGNYLFLGSLPQLEGFKEEAETEQFALMWWDETHPALRHVALDYVTVVKGLRFSAPEGAQTLIEAPHGAALVRYFKDGRHLLVLGWAVEQSTWPLKQSFPVFVYNAVRFMGSDADALDLDSLQPGDALRISMPPGVESAEVIRPDNRRTRVRADASQEARFAGTSRTGVYRVEPGIENRDRFAINLCSPRESDIRPRSNLRIGNLEVSVGEAIKTATPEIWRWFVGAALLIAMIEWYIYNRRVMI